MRYRNLLLVAVCFFVISCGTEKKETNQAAPLPEKTRDSLIISYAGADSMSVLALLEAGHEVVSVSSALGTFVKTIDGIENSQRLFWFYSVNNVMGDIAADQYMTSPEDTIRWHFRFIGPENKSKNVPDKPDTSGN